MGKREHFEWALMGAEEAEREHDDRKLSTGLWPKP